MLSYAFKDKWTCPLLFLGTMSVCLKGLSPASILLIFAKPVVSTLCTLSELQPKEFSPFISFSKSHTNQRRVRLTNWSDRPSSFDFSLSQFFPSRPLHKMTSGSPHLIPAHKFQHQYLVEVPLPSSHGRSYHQLPLSCAPGTKVRITRNSSSYKLSCVYLEAVWIWLWQNISFLNDRSRSLCAVGRLAWLVERAVWA